MQILHVYQQRIRRNIKASPADREPPIIVRQGRKRWYATEVEIRGPSRIVYSPDKPLDCGARLWVEVADGVEIVPAGCAEIGNAR